MSDVSDLRAPGKSLPPVLVGPILRRVSTSELVLWLVGSERLNLRLKLDLENIEESLLNRMLTDNEVQCVQIGSRAFIHLINVALDVSLPVDTRVGYDLGICTRGEPEQWIKTWASHLCLPNSPSPDFVVKTQLDQILHGSCRRPHHPAADGLVRVDRELENCNSDISKRPALLLMTGDQIYADDVAGPMLRAIHSLIECLGLFDETLQGSDVEHSKTLRRDTNTYYHREDLLPENKASEAVLERVLGGVRKPVFTTASAHNHLISLNEMMAMYLLVWSPVCWEFIEVTEPELTPDQAQRFRREQKCIEKFAATLPQAARALAHLPCYMIFDDHDISDDWNLSADWEETAYGHPFSKRIIGNALIAYMLCQAWGNNPAAYKDVLPLIENMLDSQRPGTDLDDAAQQKLIDQLLQFRQWGYSLATTPPMIILDTRTRRWRSGISRRRPSGLMSWEALMEFQQDLIGKDTVIVVSPTPMFGVKLIEVIQRVFTFFGRPLIVDAENWMAHSGTAHALFQIFRHAGTPQNFIILSGDVHYSFVYDVRLRNRPESPRIWQITSSGIKNEFPEKLLEWLDRLNRWLYAPRSPLNWFTKRRHMQITPRLPTGRDAGERLWNGSGIGLVVLDETGAPAEIYQLDATEGKTQFLEKDKAEI